MDEPIERWQISSMLLRGWFPEDCTKALFADVVDIVNSNVYWKSKCDKEYTSEKE